MREYKHFTDRQIPLINTIFQNLKITKKPIK